MSSTETGSSTSDLRLDAVVTIVADAVVSNGITEEVGADTELLLTGMVNSLAVTRIVAELERRFDVTLPRSLVVARNFRSPRTLFDAVSGLELGAE